MWKMVKLFFRSMFGPVPPDYLNPDNVDPNVAVDDELVLNNIDISVKASLLALLILGLPKTPDGDFRFPKRPKPPKVNYEFLAKLYKKSGEQIEKNTQGSINSDEKFSKITTRRKEGGRLIIGLGPPEKKFPLKERQIELPKSDEQSTALVPLRKSQIELPNEKKE